MEMTTKERAVEYYRLIGEKNREEVDKRLHADVEFYGPGVALKGKEAVLHAITKFMEAFSSLTIRAEFGEREQAMVVYEVDIPPILKSFPGASFLTFQGGLITRIQIFYDASPLQKQREEIFAKS